MKTFVSLLKREFWEHRGGFLWTPFIVVGMFVLFTVIGLIAIEVHISAADLRKVIDPIAQAASGIRLDATADATRLFNILFAALSLGPQLVLGIVLFFYLIGALFDDRKDRSILFWKSMPVSDIQTVGSKVVTAAFTAPLIALGAAIAFQLTLLVIIGIWLGIHGINVFKLLWAPGIFDQVHPIRTWLCMFIAIPVNALWAMPTYGWLLMVSSWARSKPFIWSVAVPLVAGALMSWMDMLTNLRIPETWMWFHVIPRGLTSMLPYSWSGDGVGYNFSGDHTPADVISLGSLGEVLGSANLWIGVVAGAAMIAVAVYLRRYREIAD